MRRQSATFDEPVYIAAGYSYIVTGDFRLKRDAPPLVATLSGLSLSVANRFGNQLSFDTGSRLWNGRTEYQFASQFFAAAADPHRTLQLARVPVVMVGALLGLYVFRFGRLLLGGYAALLPLFLFSFDPNMIAHSRIVSADLAWTAFFFIAHYYFYRMLVEDSPRHVLGLSLAVALTVTAKFSGLLVVPSLGLVGALFYFRPEWGPVYPHSATRLAQRRRLRRALGVAALTSTVTTLVLISFLYRSTAGVSQYVAGVQSIYGNGVPDFKFYLLGSFTPQSVWYYYPVALLLKTPDLTLALLALAALAAFIPRSSVSRAIWLLAPAALVLGVSSQDPVTLGLRRVVPVYPFFFLWIGERGEALRLVVLHYTTHRAIRAIGGAAAAALVVIGILTAVQIHPYQLAYFNRAAGGPASGYRCLDDSNIDWGQDLPSLASWQAGSGARPLTLWYFGSDDPASYGIDWRPIADSDVLEPRHTVYAMSVNNLIGLKLKAQESGRADLDWLERYHPVATIGYSIFIYDFR